jgi:CubicO group peptidase (beta-lactamase class C family)
MYGVLSYLPTQLLPSKPPIARYVKQYILDPLGMASTTYSFATANATGLLSDGMAMDANATARVLPFWYPAGGENGNRELYLE